jgi:hypothetical protein
MAAQWMEDVVTAPSEGALARADSIVGRERELGALDSALDAALDGVGGAVVLIGDQGMGKTRLASELAVRSKDRGFVVSWGRAWEGGGAPAYWAWVQVIRGLIESLGDDFVGHIGDRAEIVSQVVPEVAKVVGGLDSKSGVTEDRFALFDAVATTLMSISRAHPLFIVLEDLHAADEGSLHLLDFVVRSARDGRMLVLATYSDAEAPAEVGSILSSIASHGRRLELTGLDRDEVAEIYERFAGHTPTDPMLSAVHSATEGNPFFVEEAMRLATSIGDLHRPDHSLGFRVPEGAREVVERRLSPLPNDVVKVLAIASVIGREFDISTLQEICDTPMEPLLDTLGEATKARIVREVGALGRYAFAHVLIRETLYESLASGERMRLHRLIGEVLEERYRDDLDSNLDQLAHHFFKAAQAGDKPKTYDYLIRAATHARSLTAFEEAARLYGRALKMAELAGISSSKRAKLAQELEDVQHRANESVEPPAPVGETTVDAANRFAREGDYWTITHEGNVMRMKDSKGLRYLAHLLANPGQEIHALDLVGIVEGRPAATRQHSEPDLQSDALGDAGAVLDATAKAQYRRRLEELQEDIEEAEQFNDSERAARAREEMDALLEQLGAAVGLGGRDRKAASQAERARLSVTKAVKSAVTRIGEADTSLGRHLVTTVKTGTFCSYNPDPRMPAGWTF